MAMPLKQTIEQPEDFLKRYLDLCELVATRLDQQIERLEDIVEQHLHPCDIHHAQ